MLENVIMTLFSIWWYSMVDSCQCCVGSAICQWAEHNLLMGTYLVWLNLKV